MNAPFASYPHHLGGTCHYFRSESDALAYVAGRAGFHVAETTPGRIWCAWQVPA